MNLPPLAAPAARPVPASRARLWVQRLTLLTVVTLLLLGTLELLLAFAPGLFGEQRLNEVYSRYDIRPGGIYVRERRAGLRFMWPDFSTENYWNGYRWQHSTDSRGFRNPPGTPTEVLLLGDSLIYGHGVEEPETVAAFLRSEWGVGAYNMGRQGAALFDEYVFLRTFLPELTPRSVVLFVFLNDFDDLEVYRTAEQIAAMPEIDQLDYAAIRQWAGELPGRLPAAPRRWLWRRPSLRLLLSAAKELRSLAFTTPAWAADLPPNLLAVYPPFLAPLLDPDRRARLATYYTRILGDLAERCRARGIDLRIVYLGAGPDPQTYARCPGVRRRPGARRRRRERLALLRQPGALLRLRGVLPAARRPLHRPRPPTSGSLRRRDRPRPRRPARLGDSRSPRGSSPRSAPRRGERPAR